MRRLRMPNFLEELEDIWQQVPPDYYQEGVKKNILQRMWHTRKLRTVLELVEAMGIKPKYILDVGCASGWFLSQVAIKYPRVKCSGVDVYGKAIEYGKNKYKSLQLIRADAHKLPFPNKVFDLVICTEVLEHVADPGGVLREIKRVLSPNGIAIIEMDTGNLLFQLVWHWWTNIRRGVWRDSHIHAFNTKKLEKMILKSGFLITKKRVFNFTMAVVFALQKKGEER